jgi:hypothetical protein
VGTPESHVLIAFGRIFTDRLMHDDGVRYMFVSLPFVLVVLNMMRAAEGIWRSGSRLTLQKFLPSAREQRTVPCSSHSGREIRQLAPCLISVLHSLSFLKGLALPRQPLLFLRSSTRLFQLQQSTSVQNTYDNDIA